MKMVKNFIANLPVVISLPFQVIIKICSKICNFFIGISAALHVVLKTETGIKLRELEGKMTQAALIAKQIDAKNTVKNTVKKEPGNPRLKNIISKGDKSGKKDPTWH